VDHKYCGVAGFVAMLLPGLNVYCLGMWGF